MEGEEGSEGGGEDNKGITAMYGYGMYTSCPLFPQPLLKRGVSPSPSGGQKARVALARAAYSRANIQLLDDPLSAVDPRVGRTLFDKCIGPSGLMQGSTRVLVTHQRQYLPRCDRVAVLRDGALVALGTWQELMELQLPELVAGERRTANG